MGRRGGEAKAAVDTQHETILKRFSEAETEFMLGYPSLPVIGRSHTLSVGDPGFVTLGGVGGRGGARSSVQEQGKKR